MIKKKTRLCLIWLFAIALINILLNYKKVYSHKGYYELIIWWI